MLVFQHIDDGPPTVNGSVVTMGNLDGIHLGHQELVIRCVDEAQRRNIPSVVVTFDPHPLKILAPLRAPRLLLATEDKLKLLEELGVEIVINQRFDATFSRLGAVDFVRQYFVEKLKTRKIWVGRDLRFGQGRTGNVEQLVEWGVKWGFEVSVVEPILVNGVRVSSSSIRQLIEAGRVDEASMSLGRYHFISGNVVTGHGRGKELGYPTANISSFTEVLPADGIYATLIYIDGERRLSVSSIGTNPTFGAGPRTLESYVLDFSSDIYGKSIRLAFVKRIREERKFSDVTGLIIQIQDDVRSARSIFDSLGMKGCGN